MPPRLRRASRSTDWLSTAFAVIVGSVWTVSFLADIFMATYEPPLGLHAVMLIVVGAIFGVKIAKD